MNTVYIDDNGDDKNDGMSEDKAVYTVGRAIRVAILNRANTLDLQRASKLRLAKELLDKRGVGTS
jgi:membrane protein DedA with SNARE-associated domain